MNLQEAKDYARKIHELSKALGYNYLLRAIQGLMMRSWSDFLFVKGLLNCSLEEEVVIMLTQEFMTTTLLLHGFAQDDYSISLIMILCNPHLLRISETRRGDHIV